ncbi:hypothetical protein BDR04DRAFT_1112393 [Suillus decipiens]|nr:hypothetical protein BDR04DRAFT_1112393 [Suillus decipiens]
MRCEPKDQCFRCLGKGCDYSLGHPQNLTHCLKHAAACSKVDDSLRQAASKYLGGESASAKLDIMLKANGSQPRVPAHNSMDKPKAEIIPTKSTMIKLDFRNAGRKFLGLCMDLAIVKLIYAAALPPHIVDYQERKDLFMIVNKSYYPSSGSIIADSHIPKEAAHRRNQTPTVSVYHTLHESTTPDGRSFLIRGEENSDELHMGVMSDNTGNTRIAHQLLCAEIKTLIQVPDICHHLNLLYDQESLINNHLLLKITCGH